MLNYSITIKNETAGLCYFHFEHYSSMWVFLVSILLSPWLGSWFQNQNFHICSAPQLCRHPAAWLSNSCSRVTANTCLGCRDRPSVLPSRRYDDAFCLPSPWHVPGSTPLAAPKWCFQSATLFPPWLITILMECEGSWNVTVMTPTRQRRPAGRSSWHIWKDGEQRLKKKSY